MMDFQKVLIATTRRHALRNRLGSPNRKVGDVNADRGTRCQHWTRP